jgi:hypothetical protein
MFDQPFRRIRPVARKLGIPDRLVTFQVMRRTLGTDMQQHGTLKELMRQGHEPLIDIVVTCGFSSHAHMSPACFAGCWA